MTLRLPTEEETDGLVRRLHDGDWMLVATATGAAGGLREDLWRTSNASNTVLALDFLYDRYELRDFIRHEPRQYCSEETACRMAAAAFARARRRVVERGEPHRPVLGVGMTAAVNPGDRPKKGDHRAHIAVKSPDALFSLEATFTKGLLSRAEEGRVCDVLTLDAILKEASVGSLPYALPGVRAAHRRHAPASASDGSGFWADDATLSLADLRPDAHVIYPGSFAPLHHGHEEVAEMVELMTGLKAVFQLTSSHPAKGVVPGDEMIRRTHGLRWRWPCLVLEKDGLYVEKARRLPGFAFVIGADALLGLLDPKYYGGTAKGVRDTLEEFRRLGTRFYVVGRQVDGEYLTLEDAPVPERYRHLFRSVSGRWDVSSSGIRSAK